MEDNVITKEVMEQYEIVRKSGVTNMFDYTGVINAASRMKLCALGSLTFDEYKALLLGFNKYMKLYKIKQY